MGKYSNRIRELRKNKSLSQEQLADKLSQEQPERRAEDLQALLRPDLWDLYGTFTNSEKRMFWRGIIERIEYGNDKKFTVRFVR